MFSSTFRLLRLLPVLAFFSLAHAQDTSSPANSDICVGSPELNVTSNNINLDQKTMTFFLEGDIFVTGDGFCFSTDSEVLIKTDRNNPSEIDKFEIMGPFTLTLAKEVQTHISADKGNFMEEENKFVFLEKVVVTDFYPDSEDEMKAGHGEYYLSTDDFTLDNNVVLTIDTITIEASNAEYFSKKNMATLSNQVRMSNSDPNQLSEIQSDQAEYYFNDKRLILLSNVSGNYGPSNFSGRERLEYNWNPEEN